MTFAAVLFDGQLTLRFSNNGSLGDFGVWFHLLPTIIRANMPVVDVLLLVNRYRCRCTRRHNGGDNAAKRA